jgi:hypothetical protein
MRCSPKANASIGLANRTGPTRLPVGVVGVVGVVDPDADT